MTTTETTTTNTVRGSRWNGRCHKCKRAASVFGSVEKAGMSRRVLVTETGDRLELWLRPNMPATISIPCPNGCESSAIGGGVVTIVLKRVNGRVRMDLPCGARCLSATGHSCECACGGKNHGAGHSV